MITVNMVKAREIWRQKIREARAPRLAGLDVLFMRALESNDTDMLSKIAEEKKFLRDLPDDPRIELAESASELQKVWL